MAPCSFHKGRPSQICCEHPPSVLALCAPLHLNWISHTSIPGAPKFQKPDPSNLVSRTSQKWRWRSSSTSDSLGSDTRLLTCCKFVEDVPDKMWKNYNKVYISSDSRGQQRSTTVLEIHLCSSGCGGAAVMPRLCWHLPVPPGLH